MTLEHALARYEDEAQAAWEIMRPPLRTYAIQIRGFDSVRIEAETAGKAKYRVYQQWQHAGYGRDVQFGEFVKEHIEVVLHLGKTA